MNRYTACIFGPHGSSIYLHRLWATSIERARRKVLRNGRAFFGGRGFSFTVRQA